MSASSPGVFDALRAETMRKRARWYAGLVLAIWPLLNAFADPMSFGSWRAGLPYRIPTALGFTALWVWSRRPRSRQAMELGATLAFALLFVVWGIFVTRCTVETTVPAAMSIVLAAMFISSGLLLSWQGTAAFCLIADVAMLASGLARQQRPEPIYFTIVAIGFILYPFLVFNAQTRDRRQRAELEATATVQTLNQELQREREARTRLFINLSHDFRTPLAVIRSEVELLRGHSNETLQRALDRVDTNAGAIAELIEQLLELARLDSGQAPLAAVSCDLHAAVCRVAAQFQPARDDLQLVVVVPEHAVYALVDPAHLQRVLQNLIGNALRQLEERGGSVTLNIATEAGNPYIEVSDTGPGISPELRGRLFERFASFRPEGSTVSGIGLALARELTELNGGHLELLEERRHTTFRLTLVGASAPAARSLSPAAREVSLVAEQRAPGLSSFTAAVDAPARQLGRSRPHLLLVEDNADLRSSLERLLASRFEVHAVSSLADALRALARGTPAAILTDIMLGDGNGYDLLAAVRLRRRFARVPVLFVSALGQPSERVRGLSAGADDYVTKPFSGEELIVRLESAIRRSEERGAALESQRDDMLTELHDGVCSNLTHALLALDEVTAPAQTNTPLREAKASITEALREGRELLSLLGTTSEPVETIVGHLRWEMACAADRAGVEVHFDVQLESSATELVAPMSLHTLRRVATEAIVNAARHGGARLVRVHFAASFRELRLLIEDDGRGNPKAQPAGYGLSGVQRRVARLGGRASFGNRPAGGFFVEVALPRHSESAASLPVASQAVFAVLPDDGLLS